jgi:hypothetical protein
MREGILDRCDQMGFRVVTRPLESSLIPDVALFSWYMRHALTRCLSRLSIPPKPKMSSSKQFTTSLKPSPSTPSIPSRIQKPPAQASSSKQTRRPMRPPPSEDLLLLPKPPSAFPVVDTHTHVALTFEMYRGKYKDGKHANVYDFVQAMCQNRNVEALVDVWCEAPVQKAWKEFADAALDEKEKKWGNVQYWFALGTLRLVSADILLI